MYEEWGEAIAARVPQGRVLELEAPVDWRKWVVAPIGHGTPIMVSTDGSEVRVECGVFSFWQTMDPALQPDEVLLLIDALIKGDWLAGITSDASVATEISFGRNVFRSGDWINVVITHPGSRWDLTKHL